MFRFNRLKVGQNEENPIASIVQERRNLLTEQHDFYVVEAYKSLRTNVMFSLAGASDSKMVLVTSSVQSEGKSITAANLAISFAQSEKKTLLIDCDMRRPKLSRLLEIRADLGLSNILLQPKLSGTAVTSTKEPNLKVILAGDVPPNPSELLGSPRMQNLLDEMRQKFDYIILDTPPVNVVTDAVVLSPRTDGVLFVVRSSYSERRSVTRAVDQLKYAGAKLLGFVLGNVDESGSGYSNYRYGYGSYGYRNHYAGSYETASRGRQS